MKFRSHFLGPKTLAFVVRIKEYMAEIIEEAGAAFRGWDARSWLIDTKHELEFKLSVF